MRTQYLREMVGWAAKKYALGRIDFRVHRGLLHECDPQGKITWFDNGITLAPRTGNAPFVVVVSTKPISDSVENSLLHELAHCVSAKRDHYFGHGRKWASNLAMITSDWRDHARVA